MITRLLLSLKKAAATGGGWSLNEITSVRRVDESIFLNTGYSNPEHLSYNASRAHMGFRPRGMEALEEGPTQIPERIAMASTKGSVGPSK